MFSKTEYLKTIQDLWPRIVFKNMLSMSCIVQDKHRTIRLKSIPFNESGPNKMKETEKCRLCLQRSEEANRQKYILSEYGKPFAIIPREIESSKFGGIKI